MGRHRARAASPARRDPGFTIVEVMVAMLIFVIVSTATISILITGLQTIRENSDRVLAATIARSHVEDLRARGTSAITIGLTEEAPDGTDPDFVVRTTANWVGFDQTASACAAAEPGQAYLRVRVEVTSPTLTAPQVLDTVIQPDATQTPSGTGAAAISVIDQVGEPVSDVTIALADAAHPQNVRTYVTGVDGCIYLPDLVPTANLAVTVSHAGPPPHVPSTPTGTQQTVQITEGGLARPTFSYAPAASIVFAGRDEEFPLPGDLPVSWQINSTGEAVQESALGATVTGLWPETGGFTAWAGTCSDADPAALSATRQAFGLVGGGSTTARLASGPVRLRGLPADTPVTAEYVGPDGACALTSIALGRSNDKGILKVGLPYGDWRFVAEDETVRLDEPLVPAADGTPPEPVTVAFTLADLDNPSPSPSPSEGPSESPSESGEASPEPSEEASP
jgi:prepilin-type N-terminal cleavage/methylation domain-containing protein